MRVLKVALIILVALVAFGASNSAGAATTERASVDSSEAQANGSSHDAAITPDGRFVAFRSLATNLVSGDTNGRTDVFVRDRTLGTTVRVSVDSDGTQSMGLNYGNIAITPDGRFVAFDSDATDLVADDTNTSYDVFVHDRDTDNDGIFDEAGAIATTRVSDTYTGANGNASSNDPDMSSDGRFVTYSTFAYNLLPTDINGNNGDVIVRDRDTDADGIYDESGAVATIRVNVSSADVQGYNTSVSPAISSTGRFVAFESSSDSLVTGDTNAQFDIFVRDRDTDNDGIFDEPGAVATTRVNLSTAGAQSSGGASSLPDISANGRYVSFQSGATGLVSPDICCLDIFVRDRDTDSDNVFDEAGAVSTTLASIDSAENQVAGNHQISSISPDGRYVAFISDATTLVPGDTNDCFGTPGDCRDVFIRDRTGGYTIRASVASDGTQANNESAAVFGGSFIGDGGVLAFASPATNLVASSGDTNGAQDVFVRLADTDGDLILEPADNCPNTANANQANADNDALGNACDTEGPSPNTNGLAGADDCNDGVDNNGNGATDAAEMICDADGDGTSEVVDNCPGVPNADQANPDGDTFGSACDNCPTTASMDQTDGDGDGIGNLCDNCPNTDNGPAEASVFGAGNQTDSDGDGVPGTQPPALGTFGGDACDYDDDNDGVPDGDEWPGCRTRAEDYDGHEDTDGCPDTDNDADGICDASFAPAPPAGSACTVPNLPSPRYSPSGSIGDQCNNVPETFDGYKDLDGCPDPDNDNDGFPDDTDDCPATDYTAGPDGTADTGDEPLNGNMTPIQTKEDYDGVIDYDGCHDSPEDDYDLDSRNILIGDPPLPIFRDEREAHVLGTDPVRACAATPEINDEPGLDAWPFDFNDDQIANLDDVLRYNTVGVFGAVSPSPSYNGRFDFDADGAVNLGDVLRYNAVGVFGSSCAP